MQLRSYPSDLCLRGGNYLKEKHARRRRQQCTYAMAKTCQLSKLLDEKGYKTHAQKRRRLSSHEVGGCLAFRLSLSSACCSRISASGEIWYLPDRIHDRSRFTGSNLSFVKPSAIILLVGNHLTIPRVVRMDSRMITTSIDVRLSSIDVGAEGEIKWSNKDLQSVASTGGLVDNTSRARLRSRGPSKTSDMSRESHSATPVATDMACASPLNVELTARGSRYDLHTAGVQADTLPSLTSLLTKPTRCIQPVCGFQC